MKPSRTQMEAPTDLDGVDVRANIALRVQLDDVHGWEVLETFGQDGRLAQPLEDASRLCGRPRCTAVSPRLASALVGRQGAQDAPGLQRERSISLNLTMTLSQWFSS